MFTSDAEHCASDAAAFNQQSSVDPQTSGWLLCALLGGISISLQLLTSCNAAKLNVDNLLFF